VYVTGEPLNLNQRVGVSLPICSFVAPVGAVVMETGKVTGIGTEQVFPVAVIVTPVMVLPAAE
jgi:hypothetical protein